jgi:hypothetical protein
MFEKAGLKDDIAVGKTIEAGHAQEVGRFGPETHAGRHAVVGDELGFGGGGVSVFVEDTHGRDECG